MLSLNRTGAFAGLIAAASMTAIPAQAAELPAAPAPVSGSAIFADFGDSTYNEGDAIAEQWRRGGRRGWRRNRVNAGDVITGVLILGGIAAIASAANNNNERRNRDTDYRRERDVERDYERRDDRNNDRRNSNAGSGLDNAAEQCVSRIERDVRVESVDSVNRTAEGWIVTGALFNGSGFTCQIDNNGRIADINYGGFQSSNYDESNTTRARGDDLQWSDDRYTDARDKVRGQRAQVPVQEQQQPAYPGGPLPGEEFPGDVDADLGG